MVNRDLKKEYFEWMYHLVYNNEHCNNLSYKKLLHLLNDIEFIPIISRDRNRVADGIDFRYRFGYENNYDKDIVRLYIDDRQCSCLEMMISLAFRVEEQIMEDPDSGNRTGQWFWNMIVNLGLGSMNDNRFDLQYSEDVIHKFINRQYAPNGEGGLFTLSNPKDDMRCVEIWYQMMWYLDENYDFSV